MTKTVSEQSDIAQSDIVENVAAEEYRKLPSVDSLLRAPAVEPLIDQFGQAGVTEASRSLLAQARQAIADGQPAPGADGWPARIESALLRRQQPTLLPAINATGVIIHTNLGRAPLSHAARRAVDEIGAAYSNLEYQLDAGQRGSRHDHARQLLCELTGAEDAMVVNNNAAAVYLVLAGLCAGREVVVSRGQLVEIGGGFRIPDVLRESGCELVEVGTTNRTHVHDFSRALSGQTGAVMRIHSSNFRQMGFVSQPSLADVAQMLVEYAQMWGVSPPLIDDLGSGTLLDVRPYGLEAEPTVQESVAAGADIVTFSGDKLLGGPQAGIIVGRTDLIELLRRHPMARALRVDKMTLAALDATLRSYQRGRATSEIPVWMMISASVDELRRRVETWRQGLAVGDAIAEIRTGESAVGGGSLPGETLPTVLLSLRVEQPDVMATALRQRQPPVICRIQQDRLLFDPRTVLPDQDQPFVAALKELL